MVRSQSGENTLQTFLVGVRKEEIPHFVKDKGLRRQSERRFVKESSVFAPWKKDDPVMLEQMLTENDFVKWKVGKFVKQESE